MKLIRQPGLKKIDTFFLVRLQFLKPKALNLLCSAPSVWHRLGSRVNLFPILLLLSFTPNLRVCPGMLIRGYGFILQKWTTALGKNESMVTVANEMFLSSEQSTSIYDDWANPHPCLDPVPCSVKGAFLFICLFGWFFVCIKFSNRGVPYLEVNDSKKSSHVTLFLQIIKGRTLLRGNYLCVCPAWVGFFSYVYKRFVYLRRDLLKEGEV